MEARTGNSCPYILLEYCFPNCVQQNVIPMKYFMNKGLMVNSIRKMCPVKPARDLLCIIKVKCLDRSVNHMMECCPRSLLLDCGD